MKNAREMLEISMASGNVLIENLLIESNILNHSIKRIEEEASKGEIKYTFRFDKKILVCNRNLLIEKLSSIVEKFESNGYKVIIKDTGNGYWSNISVIYYWGNNEKEYDELTKNNNGIMGNGNSLYFTINF